MRPKHTQHPLPSFPVYSCSFLSSDQFVVGGGGGASRSGIKNKLRLYNVGEDRSIDLKDEYELERGEDAPMSMASHIEKKSFVCGVNSVVEKLEKGENDNCRAFSIESDRIKLDTTMSTLPGGNIDDYQKVTVLSQDGTLLAVAGSNDVTIVSYPSLVPVADSIHTDKEIYDATFSGKSLLIATTHHLLVYSLPGPTALPQAEPASKKRKKTKSKAATNGHEKSISSLTLQSKVDLPSLTGEGSTFRAARYHPQDDSVLYTAINAVVPRSKKSKGPARQAFICKWNTDNWSVEISRKVGDRGLTCFDISADGRFVGFGSSDLTIGMLDAKSLNPLLTILKAHEFPPTFIRFNPSTSLLVSGSADNSMRIVSIPTTLAGATPTTIIFIVLALLALLVAIMLGYVNLAP